MVRKPVACLISRAAQLRPFHDGQPRTRWRYRPFKSTGWVWAITTLIAAGCGAGGHLSARDYRHEGNVICHRAQAIVVAQPIPRTEHERRRVERAELDAGRLLIRGLSGLRPPDRQRRQHDMLVRDLRRGDALTTEMARARAERDTPRHRKLFQERRSLGPRTVAALRRLGLTQCIPPGD
jgi:hypothetical protein